MRILTTGRGRSGSWQCRGVQLGGAVGDVKVNASIEQIRKYNLIVAVKRITPQYIRMLNKSGVPWIWDLVDLYPQPQCYHWNQQQSIDWVRKQIKDAKPNGVIYANCKMQIDIGIPGITVFHHARQGVPHNPIRKEVKVVGYDGSEKYLGRWRNVLEEECRKRGWQFKVNIPLHEMDIAVALRDKPYDGYSQFNWKSNVKLANAQKTGTPMICQPEPGYLETKSGAEFWVSDFNDISCALTHFEPQETRLNASMIMKEHTLTLKECAREVRKYAKKILKS